ncbi:MAG: Asp-tRNA(Asn)/Glu-tRNA(Gln) amidotransferase subunit GatA [Oscillospiraceae bacterium]|nr:Asp-tRNA(Asn)/Glu-tRNA(Gln) amidotransferase subunit GatA [Oscillospiraceae bacterium]
MEIHRLSGCEISEKIKNRELTCEEVISHFIKRMKDVDKKINAVLQLDEMGAMERAKQIDKKILNGERLGVLCGIPIGLKDNINYKGLRTTCASKILENFISPYNATVVDKILKEDGIIMGKLNMDEFAMGSCNKTSFFGPVRNPWNLNKVSGGSSGGPAAAVAALELPMTLGTDTGGSIREPASYCGVIGTKPTYGAVSRYGVATLCTSLDQVGVFGRTYGDVALLSSVIYGFDEKDSTSKNCSVLFELKDDDGFIKGKRIAYLESLSGEKENSLVKGILDKAVHELIEKGAIIDKIQLNGEIFDLFMSTYIIMMSTDCMSNLARFDGIRYGYRDKDAKTPDELYYNSRTNGFGKEVKRRIVMGSLFTLEENMDKYYNNALRIRYKVIENLKEIFKKYDYILSPSTVDVADDIDKEYFEAEGYFANPQLVLANLTGLPAISIPFDFLNDMPIGIQFIGNYFSDSNLLKLSKLFPKMEIEKEI